LTFCYSLVQVDETIFTDVTFRLGFAPERELADPAAPAAAPPAVDPDALRSIVPVTSIWCPTCFSSSVALPSSWYLFPPMRLLSVVAPPGAVPVVPAVLLPLLGFAFARMNCALEADPVVPVVADELD